MIKHCFESTSVHDALEGVTRSLCTAPSKKERGAAARPIVPLLVCCSHLLASIWLLSASDILRLKLLAGRGHHPCVLSFSVSTTTHSALPEAGPLSQRLAESLLRRIASLPPVKCPVGQCIRNRSNQLCAALVHVPSNTSACSSCPALQGYSSPLFCDLAPATEVLK